MNKNKLLVEEAAHYIYQYRKKLNINSTQMQDWCKAQNFIDTWKKEYINGGDDFLELWLDSFYFKKAGGQQ